MTLTVKTILSVVLILTAAPLAAQKVLGSRAGVGVARLDYTVSGNLKLTAESVYCWALAPLNGGRLTRLVAVQAGVTINSR